MTLELLLVLIEGIVLKSVQISSQIRHVDHFRPVIIWSVTHRAITMIYFTQILLRLTREGTNADN